MSGARDRDGRDNPGAALARAGFRLLGHFATTPADRVPDVAQGRPARALFLVGSLSDELFTLFRESPEAADDRPDPLDRYTRRALAGIAEEAGLGIVFPFEGPPYFPFQRWALRTGGFSPSPMGVLAHREYGTWLGLRAALLSPQPVEATASAAEPGPCGTCLDKPCITACPAGALSDALPPASYDVPRCLAHLRAAPDTACHTGCLARRACPYGREYAQSRDAAALHMRAFFG
ncbi:hypothetical protein [Stappia sp. MMSF_3263]|uniref:hypothetical protein n=1 Tax=Stappia sp. MMSF_3263 TaxID=3046693 RepID=UPI00273EDC32|nr:hypothetical protein [Stappia sp. MMSF_3263]